MNRCFRLLLQIVAALFSVVLVPLTVLLILLINVEALLFSPSTYTAALAREHIYERLPSIVVDTVLAQAPKTWEEGNLLPYADSTAKACAYGALGPARFQSVYFGELPTQNELSGMSNCGIGKAGQKQSIGGLAPEKMVSLLGIVLTPEWQQSIVDSFLRQAFRILNTPGSPYSIVLSLKEIKDNASGSVMAQAVIKTYFETYPACDSWTSPLPPQGSISDPTSPLLASAENALGTCHVPDAIYQQYKTPFDQLQAEFQASGLILNQPDQIDVLESWRASDSYAQFQARSPIDWRWYVQDLRWANRLGALLCLVLLVVVLALAVRSLRDFLLWLGGLLLAVGLALSLAALAVLLAAHGGIFLMIHDGAPAFAPAFKAAGGVLGAVARAYGLTAGEEGFALTFLGLVLALPALNSRPKAQA